MRNIISRNNSLAVEPLPGVIEADLERVYSVVAPVRTFDTVAAAAAAVPAVSRGRARLRPLAAGVGALAILAAVVFAVAPDFPRGGTEPASAAEMLEKSQQALDRLAQGETSYYIERYGVIDGGSKPGDVQVSRLWSRDTQHWRWEIRVIDPVTGEPAKGSFSANIRNGEEFWMVVQDGETLRVINRSTAAMGFDDVGFSPGATLEETLKAFRICEGGATVSEGEPVAGRPTSRIDCAAASASVWLDRASFVPLKQESTGRMSISSTTVAIRFDPIADDVFDYKPPSGTWINYQDRGEVIQVP